MSGVKLLAHFPMKATQLLILTILISSALLSVAQDGIRVGRTDDGRAVAASTVPLSEDEGSLSAVFDFGATRDFSAQAKTPRTRAGLPTPTRR